MSQSAPHHVHVIPPQPDDAIRSSAQLLMRFEDVAQDGRLFATSLFPGLGPTAWQSLINQPQTPLLFKQGILPILTRVVLDCTESDGPFGVDKRMHAKGAFSFFHVPAADAQPAAAQASAERIYLSMWLDAEIPLGRANLPPPEDAGRVVRAGRMFAEHTLTRPFAAPEQRRVTRLEVDGLEAVPGAATPATRPADCALAPLSAAGGPARFDGPFELDPLTVLFGLCHTDSNQHVNSIAYIRAFEETALRQLARHGRDTRGLLLRRATVGYRKPCFAGDQVRIALRTFELDGEVGAVGAFLPKDVVASPLGRSDAPPTSTPDLPDHHARAHCFLFALFRRL